MAASLQQLKEDEESGGGSLGQSVGRDDRDYLSSTTSPNANLDSRDLLSCSEYYEYVSIGVDESRRSLKHRRRQVNQLRGQILASIKTDLVAASAKLFVTLKIITRSTETTRETLADLHVATPNLEQLQRVGNSLASIATSIFPSWTAQ
ncbi:hypothetical protein BV898_10388 [Hypsibius exemplaris]|uniref:Biogenesis of lysosome-related organelles complex 1 subunit 3 n=1 Tax=Hypsibius exemplaris TaxID=2072580 RepID=A0A1W0WJZ6_HYPEX|nr:hypothetical protein BV898_10388 [Hypsibius exemplaris]